MKKIGLILANPITNYGAHLQAFSTQYIIEKLGFETVVLECGQIRNKRHLFWDIGFIVDLYYSVKRKLFPQKSIVISDDAYNKNKVERIKCAIDFRTRRLHNIKVFKTFEDLKEESKGLFAVVIGSDQMWLPGVSFGYINSLRFVPKGVLRISYATSLGTSVYPYYCVRSARNMWKQMDFISVREEQGAKVIKDICKNSVKVQVTADPTYLMTKEQWENAIPKQNKCDKKYVFCYFLGDDKKAKMCAKRFAVNNNLRLVSILSCESYSEIDNTYADEVIGAVSPEDFINWIRGAEYVFTDSFHGLAFSVINHKQFYVFYRIRKDAKHSRNSRIDNILEMWDCKDRLIVDPDIDWGRSMINNIDYEHVEQLISKKRIESLDFLRKALGVNEN